MLHCTSSLGETSLTLPRSNHRAPVPDNPRCQLSERERHIAQRRLAANAPRGQELSFNINHIKRMLCRPTTYLFPLTYFCVNLVRVDVGACEHRPNPFVLDSSRSRNLFAFHPSRHGLQVVSTNQPLRRIRFHLGWDLVHPVLCSFRLDSRTYLARHRFCPLSRFAGWGHFGIRCVQPRCHCRWRTVFRYVLVCASNTCLPSSFYS